MTRWTLALGLGPCALCLALSAGCQREARPFRDLPVASARVQKPMGGELYAGPQAPPTPENSPYQRNAWGISEGQRLFENYNCSGCHAHGGGGMGPALMDDKWIYGSHPANIFETIVEGRPNGMPSFRNKIPDDDVWKIVAYIQSLSGQAPIASLPGRTDDLSQGTPPSQRPAGTPVQTGKP